MRFSHNAKIFRGQLDVAPIASVLFILLIFLLLQTAVVFTPGIPIQLPEASAVPGLDQPSLSVAVDAGGILYFRNRIVNEDQFQDLLKTEVARSPEPITLVIQADKQVRYDVLVKLGLLARESGIAQALLAVRPAVVPQPVKDGSTSSAAESPSP